MSATAQSLPPSSATRHRTWWRALENRARLAGLELTEARGRLFGAWMGMLVVFLCVQLCVVAGLIALVAATWETSWRVAAPALVAGSLAVVALIIAGMARRKWREWEPFAETQRQWSQDAELLKAEFATAQSADGEAPSPEPAGGFDRGL